MWNWLGHIWVQGVDCEMVYFVIEMGEGNDVGIVAVVVAVVGTKVTPPTLILSFLLMAISWSRCNSAMFGRGWT